jgi:hypothetical protein
VLLGIGVAALTALFVISKLLSRASMKGSQLGCMSPQWLAEKRQSRSD